MNSQEPTTSSEPDASQLEMGDSRAAISFILITLFIDILGIGIIIPVLPELVKDFIANDPQFGAGGSAEEIESMVDSMAGWYIGWIGASYAAMQFLFAPILGALSDRFGRRPVILGSLFALGVDFLVMGFAPSITWLFVGRIFAGIMGGSFSAANSYIADISTPDNRARNFGLVGMMFGLGFIFGPALGGLLGGVYIKLPFFVSAGLALVNWLYGFFVLPESLPRDKRSSFTFAKANPLGTIGRLQAYPLVSGLALVFVCLSFAQRGLENVWVLYTGYRYGWDEMTNGLALALVGVTAAIVQGGLVRPIIARLGERKAIIVGTTISMFGFLGYGLAAHGWMIPIVIVVGSLGGITGPAIQSLVASEVGPSEQGKIQGALTSLMSLTNIFAPVFFTTGLFSHFSSPEAIFPLPGASFIVGAIFIFAGSRVASSLFRKHAVAEN